MTPEEKLVGFPYGNTIPGGGVIRREREVKTEGLGKLLKKVFRKKEQEEEEEEEDEEAALLPGRR